MAGDWIRIRSNLQDEVRFEYLQKNLGLSVEETHMLLVHMACIFKRHGDYGVLAMDAPAIDDYFDRVGLSDCMIEIGWMRMHKYGATLNYFTDVSSVRKGIGKKLREKILYDAECVVCGSRENLEIDHIIPISRGGGGEEENLQVLCLRCNRAKGTRTMDEFEQTGEYALYVKDEIWEAAQ